MDTYMSVLALTYHRSASSCRWLFPEFMGNILQKKAENHWRKYSTTLCKLLGFHVEFSVFFLCLLFGRFTWNVCVWPPDLHILIHDQSYIHVHTRVLQCTYPQYVDLHILLSFGICFWQVEDGIHFYYIRRGGLLFVATSVKDVCATTVIEFLSRYCLWGLPLSLLLLPSFHICITSMLSYGSNF